MAKQTTSRKATKITTQNKSKKAKNSILRDHNLDLVVHGKRKRIPTQRALEAQTLLRTSKKIKKVAPKIKRQNTMQRTAKEALEFLGRGTLKKVTTPIKTSTKTNEKTAAIKPTKSENNRGRSKNQSQSKINKKKANESLDKTQSKSTSRSVSTKKDTKIPIKRTKSIIQTLKDAQVILGTDKKEKKPKKTNGLKKPF